MLDLNQSYRRIADISLDRIAPRGIVAAHAGQRSAHEAHSRAGAFVRPANGGAPAGQRHSEPPGQAEARPEGGTAADRRAATEPPGVPGNGQGFRPVRGRSEVRSGEGEPDPAA